MINYQLDKVEAIKNEVLLRLYKDGQFRHYIEWLIENKDINLNLYPMSSGFRYLEFIDKWVTETGYKEFKP